MEKVPEEELSFQSVKEEVPTVELKVNKGQDEKWKLKPDTNESPKNLETLCPRLSEAMSWFRHYPIHNRVVEKKI